MRNNIFYADEYLKNLKTCVFDSINVIRKCKVCGRLIDLFWNCSTSEPLRPSDPLDFVGVTEIEGPCSHSHKPIIYYTIDGTTAEYIKERLKDGKTDESIEEIKTYLFLKGLDGS